MCMYDPKLKYQAAQMASQVHICYSFFIEKWKVVQINIKLYQNITN